MNNSKMTYYQNQFCVDCKHWERNVNNTHNKSFGKCHCLKIIDNDSVSLNCLSADSLVCSTGEIIGIEILVGEHFGCVHWTDK